jgi:hypothetical protein
MNERIRELSDTIKLELAKTIYPHNFKTWTDYYDECHRQFASKFAELIVQECAKYMYEHFPETKYKVDYMRKHMGDPNWCELIGVVK